MIKLFYRAPLDFRCFIEEFLNDRDVDIVKRLEEISLDHDLFRDEVRKDGRLNHDTRKCYIQILNEKMERFQNDSVIDHESIMYIGVIISILYDRNYIPVIEYPIYMSNYDIENAQQAENELGSRLKKVPQSRLALAGLRSFYRSEEYLIRKDEAMVMKLFDIDEDVFFVDFEEDV